MFGSGTYIRCGDATFATMSIEDLVGIGEGYSEHFDVASIP